MSTPHAVEFIRRVREDASLRERVARVSPERALDELSRLGAEIGLEFDAGEFEAAFRHDWRLRWLKFSARHPYRSTQEDFPAP